MAEFGLSANEFNTAVYVFAHYLGIDLEKEQSLLSIAETALRTLPDGWSLGIGDGDNEGIPYFFNEDSGESVWKHPKENIYLKKVKEERRKLENEADDKKKKQQQQSKPLSSTSSGNNDGSRTHTNNNNNNNKKTSLVPVNPEDEVLVFDDFEMDEEDTPVKPAKNQATSHPVSMESTGTNKNNAAKGQQQLNTKDSFPKGKDTSNNKRQEDYDDDDDDDDDEEEDEYDSVSNHHHNAKKDNDAKGSQVPEKGTNKESAPSSPSAISPKSSFPLGKGKDKRTQQHFDDDDDESMGEIEGDFFSEDDEDVGTKGSHPKAATKPTNTGGAKMGTAAAANATHSSTTATAVAPAKTDRWPTATTTMSVDTKALAPSYSSYSPSAKEGMAGGAGSKGSGGSDAVPWDDWDSEQDNSVVQSPAKAVITSQTAPAKSPSSAGSQNGPMSSQSDSSATSPAQAKSRGSARPTVIVESDDVTSLRAENKELEDCISGMQRKFDMELENLRSTQAKLERAVEKARASSFSNKTHRTHSLRYDPPS